MSYLDNLNSEQRQVLRELKSARRYKGAPLIAKKALIEAGLVESNLSTPDQAHSDRDSEGALQQRPSTGWGPTSETNTQDADQFLERAIRLAKSGRYKTSGELAQAVQGSAFPARYNQRSGHAQDLLGGGGNPSPRLGQSRGRAATMTPGTPPDFVPEESTVDTEGALVDTLLSRSSSARKGGGLLKALDARLATGAYTTTTPSHIVDGKPAKVTPGSSPSATGFKGGGLADSAAARADAIDEKRMPYKWGGGHGQRIVHAKDATPLDCSGAVSAVLGINPRVASQFKGWGSPGDGGSKGVTVYAKDSHVLMKINGHFFGTSGSNPGGGAGWIPAGKVSKAYLAGFTARHSAR